VCESRLFHRLFDKNFHQWILGSLTSVLSLTFKNSKCFEVDAIVVSILNFEMLSLDWTSLLAVSFFLSDFPEDRVFSNTLVIICLLSFLWWTQDMLQLPLLAVCCPAQVAQPAAALEHAHFPGLYRMGATPCWAPATPACHSAGSFLSCGDAGPAAATQRNRRASVSCWAGMAPSLRQESRKRGGARLRLDGGGIFDICVWCKRVVGLHPTNKPAPPHT
jgi:hypothetical protein